MFDWLNNIMDAFADTLDIMLDIFEED